MSAGLERMAPLVPASRVQVGLGGVRCLRRHRALRAAPALAADAGPRAGHRDRRGRGRDRAGGDSGGTCHARRTRPPAGCWWSRRWPPSSPCWCCPRQFGGAVLDRQRPERLGDFTAGPRTLPLAALAVVLGVFSAYVATALLALIALFTNLFFYQRLSFAAVTPAGHTLGVAGRPRAGRRLPDHRADGALRLGADPRARHPGGAGGDPDPRQPDPAAASRCSSRSRRRSPSARAGRSAPRGRSS